MRRQAPCVSMECGAAVSATLSPSTNKLCTRPASWALQLISALLVDPCIHHLCRGA